MFQKLIGFVLRRRHYWRSVSFDEIAELYTSRLITVFAINIINLFAAVYLYKLGYSLSFIALFYAIFYFLRVPFAFIMGKFVAYFGPKHGILLASLLRIPSLVAFALVPLLASGDALWAIAAFGLFQQLSSAAYDIAYTVNFSKVKHAEHAGKEIGNMQIIEKIARVASPLLGGVIATAWSPEATIILAGALFLVSAVPLFASVEPTATRTRMRLSGFPWRMAFPALVSQTVIGVDFVASGMVWTLFVTVVVFADFANNIYVTLGALASLGVMVSVVAAWLFGQMVDRHKGGALLALGVIGNTVTHLFRPFIATPVGVMGVSMANEIATSGYSLPFTRVLLDAADTSGFRTTYLMFAEMGLALGAGIACMLMWAGIELFGVVGGLSAVFVFTAVYELLLFVSRRAAN